MSVRIAEAEFGMKSLVEIVILKKAGQNMMQFLFLWQFVAYGCLGLVQLGRGDHLHCGSDLQRILHRAYSGLYFLQ